jgi:hypothetical protein
MIFYLCKKKEMKEKVLKQSVTEYAKSINKTRQAVLAQINQNRLPINVSYEKVGSTYVLIIKPIQNGENNQ